MSTTALAKYENHIKYLKYKQGQSMSKVCELGAQKLGNLQTL